MSQHWFRNLPDAGSGIRAVEELETLMVEEEKLVRQLADLRRTIQQRNDRLAESCLSDWTAEQIREAILTTELPAYLKLVPSCLGE